MAIDFKDLKCYRWDNKKAKMFMKKYHYTHSCGIPVISYVFMLGEEIKVCIVYGRPASRHLTQSIWEGGNDRNTLEFVRMYAFEDMPRNTESYCIGQSIQHLKKDMPQVQVLVSYSDISMGHVGYIYQATNWMYVGDGSSERKIFIDGKNTHRRSLYSKYGTSSIPAIKDIVGEDKVTMSEGEEKHKYIYVIKHDKRQYKEVMKKLKVKSLPYPKGELSFYSEGGGNRFDQIGDEKVVNPKDKVKDLFE